MCGWKGDLPPSVTCWRNALSAKHLPLPPPLPHLHDCQVSGQVKCEPGVLPDLGDGDPLQRVHQQHARDEVTCTCRQGGGAQGRGTSSMRGMRTRAPAGRGEEDEAGRSGKYVKLFPAERQLSYCRAEGRGFFRHQILNPTW